MSLVFLFHKASPNSNKWIFKNKLELKTPIEQVHDRSNEI